MWYAENMNPIIRFILRPFAKPIRYGALKIMKRMRPPNDMRPIIATADHILEIILPSVFSFFQDETFRELAHFKKLPVVEHDRIFNELQVAGTCLVVFLIRSMKSVLKVEDYHFWQEVETYLPK